jgi:hypothetical protein
MYTTVASREHLNRVMRATGRNEKEVEERIEYWYPIPGKIAPRATFFETREQLQCTVILRTQCIGLYIDSLHLPPSRCGSGRVLVVACSRCAILRLRLLAALQRSVELGISCAGWRREKVAGREVPKGRQSSFGVVVPVFPGGSGRDRAWRLQSVFGSWVYACCRCGSSPPGS